MDLIYKNQAPKSSNFFRMDLTYKAKKVQSSPIGYLRGVSVGSQESVGLEGFLKGDPKP